MCSPLQPYETHSLDLHYLDPCIQNCESNFVYKLTVLGIFFFLQ